MVNNPVVERLRHGRCAWCEQIIRRDSVDDHGVKYHLGCWTTREVMLAPELARDRREEAR